MVWILQEGVAIYNGKSFKYFTVIDGLSDNQIHSIQEDKKGIIWFNTQTGLSSYDGTSIRNHTKVSKENPQNHFSIQSNNTKTGKWMKTNNDLWFGTYAGVFL